MKLILGEHDKGLGVPFSPETISGRRLRTMLSEIPIPVTMDNVFLVVDGKILRKKNLKKLCSSFSTIIVLGRIAEAECNRQGIHAIYLPHPAARSSQQLHVLREGLREILNSASTKSQSDESATAVFN